MSFPCTAVIDVQAMPARNDLEGIERVIRYICARRGIGGSIIYLRLLLFGDELGGVGGWLQNMSGVPPLLTILSAGKMYDVVFLLKKELLPPTCHDPFFRPSMFESHLSAGRTLLTYYIRTRRGRAVLAATDSATTLAAYAVAVQALEGVRRREEASPLISAILEDLEMINVVLMIRSDHAGNIERLRRYYRGEIVTTEPWMVPGHSADSSQTGRRKRIEIAIRLAFTRGGGYCPGWSSMLETSKHIGREVIW
jgi:hypothetical protein